MPVTREMQSKVVGYDEHRHTDAEGRHSDTGVRRGMQECWVVVVVVQTRCV